MHYVGSCLLDFLRGFDGRKSVHSTPVASNEISDNSIVNGYGSVLEHDCRKSSVRHIGRQTKIPTENQAIISPLKTITQSEMQSKSGNR